MLTSGSGTKTLWTVMPLQKLLNIATCSCRFINRWSGVLTFTNSKKDSAKLAQEQSTHLYLISDLTQRYGPVIRPAEVVGIIDAAFDVLVPEFGIEKRVHIDQMPIDIDVSVSELILEKKSDCLN
jgi:exoribonuclease R